MSGVGLSGRYILRRMDLMDERGVKLGHCAHVFRDGWISCFLDVAHHPVSSPGSRRMEVRRHGESSLTKPRQTRVLGKRALFACTYAMPRSTWPVRHTFDLALILFVLQPTLLVFTLVDFARTSESTTFLGQSFAYLSRVLRPGQRASNVDKTSLVWEAMHSLFGIALTQAWYCVRMSGWLSMAEGYERKEDAAALKRRRIPIRAQVEAIVFSSFSLPLLWALSASIIFALGAPANTAYLGTAILAAHVTLLGLWPVSHILGLPPSPMWSRILAAPSHAMPGEILVLVPSACACLGAALGAWAQALDWGRLWQTWPLPSMYTSAIGLVVGHLLAFVMAMWQRPRMESSRPPAARQTR